MNTNKILAVNATPEAAYLEILPAFYLDADTPDQTLTAAGWRYAEWRNTGARILVRPTGTTRFLAAWNTTIETYEARTVETVADAAGVIWAAMGAPRGGRPLFGRAS
jgi:hypothetical protein